MLAEPDESPVGLGLSIETSQTRHLYFSNLVDPHNHGMALNTGGVAVTSGDYLHYQPYTFGVDLRVTEERGDVKPGTNLVFELENRMFVLWDRTSLTVTCIAVDDQGEDQVVSSLPPDGIRFSGGFYQIGCIYHERRLHAFNTGKITVSGTDFEYLEDFAAKFAFGSGLGTRDYPQTQEAMNYLRIWNSFDAMRAAYTAEMAAVNITQE